MSCTIKELQEVEYEILCNLADYCEKNSIEFSLFGGTLLGAIRHNGFIPWDDDLDVFFDYKNFKKLLKKIKKNPIPGFHLSWAGTEPEHSFIIAKLRKNGTFMPEEPFKNLDMNNGIWVDIFVYSGVPRSAFFANLKSKIYKLFVFFCRIYRYKDTDRNQNTDFEYSAKYKFASRLSSRTNAFIRNRLFGLWAHISSPKSTHIMFNDFTVNHHRYEPCPKELCTPYVKHVFNDREFNIPEKYDELLTRIFGDYMTPVEYPSHTNFDNVII